MSDKQIKVVFFDIGNTLVSSGGWLPEAAETLAILKSQGIRLGLLSNTGDLTREQLQTLLPDSFEFDVFEPGLVFLSSETGVEKPNLGAFLLAIQHAAVSPWQTMFVGETISETLAAQKAGMQAVRITDAEKDYPELLKLMA